MVDFNNEATVGTPAVDIMRVVILQRHYDIIEAFEHYNKTTFSGSQSSLAIVRSRLTSLFYTLEAMLERRYFKDKYAEEYTQFKLDLGNDSEEALKRCITFLNRELDRIGITKIDTRKAYDRTLLENENKQHGL